MNSNADDDPQAGSQTNPRAIPNDPTDAESDPASPDIAVRAMSPDDEPLASALACRLGLTLRTTCTQPWELLIDGTQWTLRREDNAQLRIDFTRGKMQRRSAEAGLARQPLLRAIGVRKYEQRFQRLPHVVDATAGLGQDAWLMASTGLSMTLLERSTLVHALLDHALDVAGQSEHTARVAARMQLHQTDAAAWLSARREPLAAKGHCLPTSDADTSGHNDHGGIDVVYVDPMYPVRQKSARVNKGMQFLQTLLGKQTDGDTLLKAAVRAARYRVVVKRPAGAPPLLADEQVPVQRTAIHSPGTRFDVYHTAQATD